MNLRLPQISVIESYQKSENEKSHFEQAQVNKKLNNYQRILEYFDTHKSEDSLVVNPYNYTYKKKNKIAAIKKNMLTPLEIREEANRKFETLKLEKKLSGTLSTIKSGYLSTRSRE